MLVNVPERSELVASMAALVAPGGMIALQDIDNVSWACEPPHDSWAALLGVFVMSFALVREIRSSEGVCRALLREAGVVDVRARAVADLPGAGQYRRTHLLSLIDSVRDKVIASGAMAEGELDRDRGALLEHLTDPDTLLIDRLLIQCWGHTPA